MQCTALATWLRLKQKPIMAKPMKSRMERERDGLGQRHSKVEPHMLLVQLKDSLRDQ
jgi:hypothetical protein